MLVSTRVVLPDPGEETRLTARTLRDAKIPFRTLAASSADCWISFSLSTFTIVVLLPWGARLAVGPMRGKIIHHPGRERGSGTLVAGLAGSGMAEGGPPGAA